MWYINGRVESLPLTDMRYINGWVERYSPSPQGGGTFFHNEDRQMKKTGLLYYQGQILRICQTHISKGIRRETDRIIIALKIQVPGYTG